MDCIQSLCHTFLPSTSVSTCAFVMVVSDGLPLPSWLLKLQSGRRRAPVALCVCFRYVCRRATLTYNIATVTVVPTFPTFYVNQSTVESNTLLLIYVHLKGVREHRPVSRRQYLLLCQLQQLCSISSSWENFSRVCIVFCVVTELVNASTLHQFFHFNKSFQIL